VEATPLAPTLKPLGVGDVLDRTFNLYKQRPLLFIALSAIWYLLLVIVFVVLAIAVFAGAIASFVRESPTDIDPATLAGAISGFIAFLIVGILVAILLFSAQRCVIWERKPMLARPSARAFAPRRGSFSRACLPSS